MGEPRRLNQATAASALRGVLTEAMTDDSAVVLLGEAVGRLGGVHRTTRGLLERFGADRVIDTPLSEAGAVGLAIGLAMGGKRPVVTLSSADRAWAAAEQLVRELPSLGGELAAPLVLRLPVGDGGPTGPDVTGLLAASGLIVATPATPGDAAGLLRSALVTRGPVALLEPVSLYGQRGAIDGAAVPFGQPRVARAGDDCTVLAWGAGVQRALDAARAVADEGLSAEVIDLRSLSPLDTAAVGAAVRRTGRVIVAGGGAFARDLLNAVVRAAFLHLESPPVAVAGSADPIARGIRDSVRY